MTGRLVPGSFRSGGDLFRKLKREATLLDEEVTSDRFFNFVVTGYSLIDWIKHDPGVPPAAKSPGEEEQLRKDKWLKICGDLATSAKHFTLTKRKPTASDVTAQQGFGLGRFGKGAYGTGEEQIEIHMPDGVCYTLFDLVDGVLTTWSTFFDDHGMTSGPAADA